MLANVRPLCLRLGYKYFAYCILILNLYLKFVNDISAMKYHIFGAVQIFLVERFFVASSFLSQCTENNIILGRNKVMDFTNQEICEIRYFTFSVSGAFMCKLICFQMPCL